jgi:hypothetical protein
MKRGLHQAALAAMKLAFAGEQAFAEQYFRAFKKTALSEIDLIRYEDIFDPFRVAYEIDVLRTKTKVNQVAMIAGEALQELGRIAAKLR